MKKNIYKLGIVIAILFLGMLTDPFIQLFPRKSDFSGKVIDSIEVVGNIHTSSSDIIGQMESKKGKPLEQDKVNSDIKVLFATGFFFFIDIKAEAIGADRVKLIVEVRERPRVKELQFIGSEELFPSDLRDKLPLKENDIVNEAKINAAREQVLKKYRDEGFFHAYIKVSLSEVDPRTNTVIVRFIIDEGEEIPISKINIIGAKSIDTNELIGFLDLKESGLVESGIFKESAFEGDKQKIVAYMRTKGYLDADLVADGTGWEIHWENSRIKDKRVVIVNFKVNEGDQYFFNGYSLEHDKTLDGNGVPVFMNKEKNPSGTPVDKLKPIYDPQFLLEMLELNESDVGVVADEGKFQRDRISINDMYSTRGYLLAQVVVKRKYIDLNEQGLSAYDNCNGKTECEEEKKRYNIDKLKELLKSKPEMKDKKFVHINYFLKENFLAYIENIIVKGNKKTQEKVIRRELLFKSGDLYNSELVNRSRERLYNLGYFKEVNFNMRQGSDESKMNLIIELIEQPTGTISMGGGYGTIMGFSIFTDIGENNLNGSGQRIMGRVEFGPYRKAMSLNWTEPWFKDKPWSLSLGINYYSRIIPVAPAQISDYSIQSIKESASYERAGMGFSVGIGHRLFINWSHFHRYSPSFYRSQNPTSLVDSYVLAEVNRKWLFRSELAHGLIYDIRDNVFNATRGFYMLLQYANIGQFLGGNSHFDQYSTIFEYYHTWFDYTFGGLFKSAALRKWKVVQMFRNSNVFMYERVPKYNRPDNPYIRDEERLRHPYIQQLDLNFMGGYESLRGWGFQDAMYPNEWRNGAQHRMLVSSELRFPLEPTRLWAVFFIDGGSLYEELNRWTGLRKENAKKYDQTIIDLKGQMSLSELYYYENFIPNSFKAAEENPFEKENPGHLLLSKQNVSLERFKFSWGFGFRIQIPVMPLRIYFAQKVRYIDGGFKPYPNDDAFRFVFGIGDYRF